MPTINESFDLLSEEEVAALLNKTLLSLRNERSKGGGPPFIRLGGTIKGAVKYRRSAVEKWLKSRETDPGRDSKPTLATSRRKRA